MVNNKVKFNLWNVHYAPLIENTIDKVKYGTPIPIPGAVSLSLDIPRLKRIQCKNRLNIAYAEQKYELAIQK